MLQEGVELSKGVTKKLAKEQAKQKEAHEKYIAKLSSSVGATAEP